MPDQKLDQLLNTSKRIEYQLARIAEATTEFRLDLEEIKALIQQQSYSCPTTGRNRSASDDYRRAASSGC